MRNTGVDKEHRDFNPGLVSSGTANGLESKNQEAQGFL